MTKEIEELMEDRNLREKPLRDSLTIATKDNPNGRDRGGSEFEFPAFAFGRKLGIRGRKEHH